MQFKLFHCWDCGSQVLLKTPSSIEPTFDMRQVRFRLEGGSYCESPFCHACAIRPWPPERIEAFETALNKVRGKDPVHVVEYEGYRAMSDPIVGVLGPR